MYQVAVTAHFQSSLAALPRPWGAKFAEKIRTYIAPQLRQEPHFGINVKKLKGWNPDTWRYRIGNFRLFYRIDEQKRIVVMTEIEARKDAY